MEERPWAEWRKGRPITPAGLAALLRHFDIKPVQNTTRDNRDRGYAVEAFTDAFERYTRPGGVNNLSTCSHT